MVQQIEKRGGGRTSFSGKFPLKSYVYGTTSAERQVDTRRVERIEVHGADLGFMCYAMSVHGRRACPGISRHGTAAGGSEMGRTHGRSAHQAGTEVTTACGEVERGLTVERGCACGKGHLLGYARLESAMRGRKTEVQRHPEMHPGQRAWWRVTVLVVRNPLVRV